MRSRQGEWRFELASPTLEAIEQFCLDFQPWRARHCPGLDAFSAELVLREALTNSVVHGCSGTPPNHIWGVLRAKPGRLLIYIGDDGAGFDWRAAWDRQAENSDSHGRGIEIFRRYANAVRFNSKGNSTTLVKKFATG
jgi:anti-sigma regulatory factor (Ser/Thr protein kinase)